MKRAALLHCAGWTAQRFKLLQRHDQLPFHQVDEPDASRWSEFSIEDAFRLRLMHELIDAESSEVYPTGTGPSFARSVVANATQVLCVEAAEAHPVIWIAHVTLTGEVATGQMERHAFHYCGTLGSLEYKIEASEAAFGDAYQSHAATRIFLANATNAAKFVLRRAKELDVLETRK